MIGREGIGLILPIRGIVIPIVLYRFFCKKDMDYTDTCLWSYINAGHRPVPLFRKSERKTLTSLIMLLAPYPDIARNLSTTAYPESLSASSPAPAISRDPKR